jgi:hypothetical protein
LISWEIPVHSTHSMINIVNSRSWVVEFLHNRQNWMMIDLQTTNFDFRQRLPPFLSRTASSGLPAKIILQIVEALQCQPLDSLEYVHILRSQLDTSVTSNACTLVIQLEMDRIDEIVCFLLLLMLLSPCRHRIGRRLGHRIDSSDSVPSGPWVYGIEAIFHT